MRRICYSIALTLDGYIVGLNGKNNWIIPVLLGAGKPLLPLGGRAKLRLNGSRVFEKTGTVLLEYVDEKVA